MVMVPHKNSVKMPFNGLCKTVFFCYFFQKMFANLVLIVQRNGSSDMCSVSGIVGSFPVSYFVNHCN